MYCFVFFPQLDNDSTELFFFDSKQRDVAYQRLELPQQCTHEQSPTDPFFGFSRSQASHCRSQTSVPQLGLVVTYVSYKTMTAPSQTDRLTDRQSDRSNQTLHSRPPHRPPKVPVRLVFSTPDSFRCLSSSLNDRLDRPFFLVL